MAIHLHVPYTCRREVAQYEASNVRQTSRVYHSNMCTVDASIARTSTGTANTSNIYSAYVNALTMYLQRHHVGRSATKTPQHSTLLTIIVDSALQSLQRRNRTRPDGPQVNCIGNHDFLQSLSGGRAAVPVWEALPTFSQHLLQAVCSNTPAAVRRPF